MKGDRHLSQWPGESARDFHARAHGMVSTMAGAPVPFERCPGYPCRTYRLGGWLRERAVGLYVRARRALARG